MKGKVDWYAVAVLAVLWSIGAYKIFMEGIT